MIFSPGDYLHSTGKTREFQFASVMFESVWKLHVLLIFLLMHISLMDILYKFEAIIYDINFVYNENNKFSVQLYNQKRHNGD